MRKITLGVAVSLDGFIEGPRGEYDWCFTDQDYGMSEFLRSIGGIIYGRKSFQIASLDGGENPFASIPSYVVSKSLPESKGYTLLRDVNEIKRMKETAGKDLWLFGGASLTSSMMKENLIDELWLAIHPIILGKGKPLFENVNDRVHLELISTTPYNTGLISTVYRVKRS